MAWIGWISIVASNSLLVSDAAASDKNPYAVPTFECIGIYYKAKDAGECKVLFRKVGDTEWRESLGLVYDPRDGEYRGSLVGLEPHTDYEIQLQCDSERVDLRSRTRSEVFPVGKITHLEDGVLESVIHITESGTPDAYHLVTPGPSAKTTVDAANAVDYAAIIDANYVIFRGVELKNAAIHGILIKRRRHDIVIEDCRVTFWGRIGGPITFGNVGGSDSAIFAERGVGNLVIQRNLLEHPRGASNDWDTGHPSGPQGITLINSTGGNIIRYNEILSTEDHGFNDGFGGASNFSYEGSPNRDSDIYGNIIRNVWDDAVESEGANMNVRIWGNYTHLTYQHIAAACTSKGPLYIFRNVFGESRRTHKNPLGGSMIKVGERGEYKGGRRFVFHNTALQPKGCFHAFSGHVNRNCVTRNNVFDCPGRLTSSRQSDPPSDFDYDLFTGMDRGIAKEEHRIRAKPSFVESYYLEFYPAATTTRIKWGKVPFDRFGESRIITDPVVTIPNPMIDAGVLIPGFNDDYAGKGPDLGAFEVGRPPLRFGRRAKGNVWAPWEMK